jgi:hypothetical protein
LGSYQFIRCIGSLSANTAASFSWSDDVEDIEIATDVRAEGGDNCDAVGYIGSGFTKTAIYVRFKTIFPSIFLLIRFQARFNNKEYAFVTMQDGHQSDTARNLQAEFELLLLGDFFHSKFLELAKETEVELPRKFTSEIIYSFLISCI